jgi:hypothetical protein
LRDRVRFGTVPAVGREAAMTRVFLSILVLSVSALTAQAQDSVRIFPGFEKVYKDSKKREVEALRVIAAAEAEIAASDQQRLEGERQMADADAALQSQQLSYLTLTRSLGQAQSAQEARVEVNQLDAAARAWADAEKLKERGAKTVMAADANRARAVEKLTSARGKLADAQAAIARTLQDAPQQLAQPAALTPVERSVLPPAPKDVATPPQSAAAPSEPQSALDSLLLGGPDGDRP